MIFKTLTFLLLLSVLLLSLLSVSFSISTYEKTLELKKEIVIFKRSTNNKISENKNNIISTKENIVRSFDEKINRQSKILRHLVAKSNEKFHHDFGRKIIDMNQKFISFFKDTNNSFRVSDHNQEKLRKIMNELIELKNSLKTETIGGTNIIWSDD